MISILPLWARRTVLVGLLCSLPTAAALAQPATLKEDFQAQPCVFVLGQGKNSDAPRQARAVWNAINEGLLRFMVEAFEAERIVAVGYFFAAEHDDEEAVSQETITMAAAAGCTRLVEVSAYSPFSGMVTIDVWAHALQLTPVEGSKKVNVKVTQTLYEKSRQEMLDDRFLRDFIISDAAEAYAKALMASPLPR